MPQGEALWRLQPRLNLISEWLVMCACGMTIDPGFFVAFSAAEWRLARAVAWSQGIAGLLHVRTQDAPFGPSDWRAYLAAQYASNRARVERMLSLLERILDEMNLRGIAPMPLKGMDLITRIYDDAALRPIGDIDLLVRPQDMAAAGEAVIAAGFAAEGGIKRHDVFVLPPNTVAEFLSERPDNPIKVELHPAVSGRIARLDYDLTERMWRGAAPESWRGRRILRSDIVALQLHLLVHAASDMHPRLLRAVRMHDAHLVYGRMSDSHMRQLLSEASAFNGSWWAFAPSALTTRYYPGSPPRWFLDELRARTHASLHWLIGRATATSMSACNVRRTSPFEFVAWAQTPAQALEHAFTIFVPTREDRDTWQLKSTAPGTSIGWSRHLGRLSRALNGKAVRAQSEMLFKLAD